MMQQLSGALRSRFALAYGSDEGNSPMRTQGSRPGLHYAAPASGLNLATESEQSLKSTIRDKNSKTIAFENSWRKPCIALALALLAGCAGTARPKTLPPGAINSFDATTYDVLATAQAALNGFKADLPSLPSSQVSKVTPALDQAIRDYNLAEAGWQAYHAGKSGDTAALSASVGQVVVDLAALQDAMPATKK